MVAAGSKGDGENNGGSYQSPTEETLTPIPPPPPRSSSSTTPPLPTLPLDLITEILCWLPVKFLLQFCCVCKSWNHLISQDSKFQKKHFHLSRIQNIPYGCRIRGVGISVSDTVDWLVYDVPNSLWVILSLDLEADSYKKLLHPLSNERSNSDMVFQELKGCLCIISQCANYSDVWIMKEHGNEQSWTKLLSVPYMTDGRSFAYSRALYVSEDDQVLMRFLKLRKFSLIIYDFKNDTFKIPKIQNINEQMIPTIYVESLISPFSQY